VCGEAKDGQEALEKAKDLRPDIVLMDVSMPRMDGIQATRIIRRELPESAVIIVSQNDPSVVAVQAAAVDASGYVDKNELSRDLLPAIEKLAVRKNGQKQPNLKSPDARQKDAELAKQAKLLDFSFNAVILRDEEDRITYWNKAAEELYGWAEAEALGRVTHALLKTEFPEPLDSIFELLRRDGKWQGELTHTRKNGTQLTVLSRWGLTFDPKTNAESIMEANIDVTQAKEAERANSLLAAIVGSSDDAIVSKRLDGVISSWNKAAERMFGYSAAEAVGQHITLIIPPDRRDEETQILQRLRRGERIEHFETIRIRKDGGLLDVSLTISPVKDASGKIIGASKVARDVTDRKRADERLRKSEEQLRTLAGELEKQVHIRTQELEQRNAEVLQQSDQLRELSNRLLQTQDDERRHVARELHDSAHGAKHSQ
jgi:PAS domain S-box-containing protein